MITFCPQITTAQIKLTTQERQNYVLPSDNNSSIGTDYPRKTELFLVSTREKITFCPQITTAQMQLTTQERQNYVLPSDNNS